MTKQHQINDLSHLNEEEFIALCPQGEHAPGPEPLSPAAQAVMIACNDAVKRLPLNSPPEQFSIAMIAAALRAAADQVVPEVTREPHGNGFRWGGWAGIQGVRRDLLAIATELEAQL
jgi:hypothetical protein